MNTKLGRLLLKGFSRRKKEILRVCAATFLAIFFISGVLLFQENMYQWQMAENRKRFGDWFVIENYQQTKALENHEYLTEAVTAGTYAMMYDKDWMKTKINVGYMTDEFIDNGNIRVADGRMPENDNEIACDYNTLSRLGYSSELGQTITFNYFNDNNSSSCSNPQRSASYVLTGVLDNFTDSWSVGRYIPGALLTKEGCELLDSKVNMVYMYGLKDSMRTDDYQPIYEELSSYNSKKIFFNTNVYDFEPWGPKSIYNYIYFLVMVIGIAALTYQIISYQHSRTQHYMRLYRLGTTKKTIWNCRTLEDLLILLPSGVLGILVAVLIGRIIGWILESKKGVAFFNVNGATILKSILSLLLALLVAELVNLFITYVSRTDAVRTKIKKKQPEETGIESAVQNDRQYKSRLHKNNVTWQMQSRLSRSNGIAMRIGARIFALGIAAVLVFCGYNIYHALDVYNKNSAKSDITGFQVQDGSFPYLINIAYDTTQEGIEGYAMGTMEYYMAFKTAMLSREEYIAYRNETEDTETEGDQTQQAPKSGILNVIPTERYSKMGNSTIVQGIDESLKSTIESTKGIEGIQMSSFETARSWSWEDQSLTKMSANKLTSTGSKVAGYSDTYVYGTEYVDPTEELYQRLSKYMDPSQVDYDAFCNGDQVLVFLQKNINVGYDDTIQPGITLDFHYYMVPVTPTLASSLTSADGETQYQESIFPYWNQFIDLSKGLYLGIESRYNPYGENDTEDYYVATDNAKTDEFYGLYYKMLYEPCASAKVAAVVNVTDEVKEDLSDILADYGYYTAIASTKLGEKECEQQNELMKEFLGDRYTEDLDCHFEYNQITATYDLSASYSATDNILCSYFRSNDVTYKSTATVKEEYRTAALNAILQYGITAIAAIVINILIYSILTRNRLELRRKKLELLAKLGAGKPQIVSICCIEILRESLWCIFTAPLQILVQYLICRHTIHKF